MIFLLCTCVQGKTHIWRKREAYIAAVRRWYERANYNHWKNFTWKDFNERQDLRITFDKRHFPVSDGNDHPCFDGKVTRLKSWDKEKKVLNRKTGKNRKRKSKTKSPQQPVKKNKKSRGDSGLKVYDHRTNTIVSVFDVDDDGFVCDE